MGHPPLPHEAAHFPVGSPPCLRLSLSLEPSLESPPPCPVLLTLLHPH